MNQAKPIFNLLIGAALALVPAAQAKETEPSKAVPHCKLAHLDSGASHDLAQYTGKVLYVDFWASWCGPCAESFPFMNKLDHDLRGKGLQVVGINLDEDPADARAFLERHAASFVNVADASGGQCPQDFGVMGMPSSYLIDRQGVIRHVSVGFKPGEAEKFRALVEQLLDAPAAKNR